MTPRSGHERVRPAPVQRDPEAHARVTADDQLDPPRPTAGVDPYDDDARAWAPASPVASSWAASRTYVPVLYVVVMAIGEILARLVLPGAGMAIYAVTAIIAVNHAAAVVGAERRLVLALAVVALHRLVLFGAPGIGGGLDASYVAVAAATVAGIVVLARQVAYSPRDLGLRLNPAAVVASIGLLPLGYALGIVLQPILRPGYLGAMTSLPMVVLLATGIAVVEELLFRGLLQRAACEYWSPLIGVAVVALLYTMLAGAGVGAVGLGVVFLSALGLGVLTRSMGSIIPAAAAHAGLNAGLLPPGPFGP